MVPGLMRRKFALLVQLSGPDDYVGGDLTVGPLSTAVPRAMGTVVALPGWTTHGVAPITDGERFSLVVACYGPQLQ